MWQLQGWLNIIRVFTAKLYDLSLRLFHVHKEMKSNAINAGVSQGMGDHEPAIRKFKPYTTEPSQLRLNYVQTVFEC